MNSMCPDCKNGTINVRDLGELNEKPCYRTRIEWYSAMAVFRLPAPLPGCLA
ncbi:hypothetical protein P7H19_10570 [Paenibacillus larvae]|nr:hypothetical protein [Paenibacillus larvae]MDT2236649.1 hypothetical protein [Paenibacillus larvae]